jgi:lysophospholipase L1-like esterase
MSWGSRVVYRELSRAMLAVAAALFCASPGIVAAQAVPHCSAPADMTRLANPLSHIANKLAAGQPIKIVAIGSSSTAGAGASAPGKAYPARLEVELSKRFARTKFIVLNRGVNGEEAKDMIRRFGAAVIAEHPDLVIWQLGTNSVLRDHPMSDNGALIRQGLTMIKSTGADIVLIDPQFAPKVIAKPDAERMVELIGATAKRENVDLFRRFALMRRWRDVDHIGFESFVSPDGVHMNDWSYGCLARSLADAIAEAATRPVSSASAAVMMP